jgi:DNA-binding GntR family transcriptional regulator
VSESALPPDVLGAIHQEGVADPAAGARERAYAVLRTAILRGALPAGTLLNEADIGVELGISRTPVRAALQSLLQEELIEIGARRQLYVRTIPPAARREVILLREALERVTVREACEVMTLEEIDELRLVLIRQRRAAEHGDIDRFIELDDQFHIRIAIGARLPTAQRFLEQIRALIRMMGLRAATRQGRMTEVIAEHEAIVVALEARDADAALARLMDHLAATYRLIGELDDESSDGRVAVRELRGA